MKMKWEIVKRLQIAQEISKYKLYKIHTKLKTCINMQNKLIFRLPRWGILRYCLCFNQKDEFVNWARQVRHVSESPSLVVQL